MSRWFDILREVMTQSGTPLEEQEKTIQACLKATREEKREKRRLENKYMSEFEKKEKKEKTRELNETKKEKQQEWKETHKKEIKKYNNIYYEQNKEAIKNKILKTKRDRCSFQLGIFHVFYPKIIFFATSFLLSSVLHPFVL